MGSGASTAFVTAVVKEATEKDLKEALQSFPPEARMSIAQALTATEKEGGAAPDVAMPTTSSQSTDQAAGEDGAKASQDGKVDMTAGVEHVKSADLKDDLPALKLLVANALKERGWRDVDHESIEIKKIDESTYKVSAPAGGNTVPPRVAFHARGDRDDSKESLARLEAASQLFARSGLGPQPLAVGADWSIETWVGSGQPSWTTVADMRVLGKEVAKVHQLPVDWFAPFKAQLKEEFPIYANVPDGCHIWWNSCRTTTCFYDPDSEDCDMEWASAYAQPLFTPQTKAGARIVTCHGDLHAGNMISLADDCAMRADSVKFIDLEFCHVSNASSDLGYVCFHYEDMPLKDKGIARDPPEAMRRAFLESYLEAMGEPFTKQDVDALYIDACLGAGGHHFGPCGMPSPGHDLDGLKRFRQHADELLASEAEQAAFHELGPEGWFAKKGFAAALKDINPACLEAFKFLDRIVAHGQKSEPQEEGS